MDKTTLERLRQFAGAISRATNSFIIRKAQDLQKHGDHDQSTHGTGSQYDEGPAEAEGPRSQPRESEEKPERERDIFVEVPKGKDDPDDFEAPEGPKQHPLSDKERETYWTHRDRGSKHGDALREATKKSTEFGDLTKYIRHEGDKWTVYSESGKPMGTYDSEAGAKERLRNIEYFKHRKGMIESLRDAVSKLSQRRI